MIYNTNMDIDNKQFHDHLQLVQLHKNYTKDVVHQDLYYVSIMLIQLLEKDYSKKLSYVLYDKDVDQVVGLNILDNLYHQRVQLNHKYYKVLFIVKSLIQILFLVNLPIKAKVENKLSTKLDLLNLSQCLVYFSLNDDIFIYKEEHNSGDSGRARNGPQKSAPARPKVARIFLGPARPDSTLAHPTRPGPVISSGPPIISSLSEKRPIPNGRAHI